MMHRNDGPRPPVAIGAGMFHALWRRGLAATFGTPLLLIVGLHLAIADAVARPDDMIRETPASATGVSFRYIPPTPRILDFEGGKPNQRTIVVADAGLTGALPDDWILPVHTAQILVPAGHDWSLDFRTVSGSRIEDVSFARVPTGGRAAERGADSPRSITLDGVFPESPVTGSLEIYRGRTLLLLTLAPVQFDPIDGTATTFESIEVDVRFHRRADAPGRAVRPFPTESAGDDFWKDLILNPEALSADTGGPPLRSELVAAGAAGSGRPDTYFDDAPIWLKVGVNANGIYRINAATVTAAGVDARTIDPATIRIFANPGPELDEATHEADVPAWGERGGFRELAIHVREGGASNRTFEDVDTLLFYGLAIDNFGNTFDPAGSAEWLENEHTGTNVYWMTWGGSFPAAPLRMATLPGGAQGEPVNTVLERSHVEINDPALYDPLPRERGVRWEKWWWQRIEDSGASYFWDIPLPDIDTTRTLSMTIRWWGSNTPAWSAQEPTQRHFLRVSVNDQPEIAATWGGFLQGISRYDMAIADLPARTTNRVIATVTEFAGASLRIDQILLGWMELDWWRRLSLSGQHLAFRGTSAAPGPVTFEVAGSEGGARVLDVTSPWAPAFVPAGRLVISGVATLAFNVDDPTGRRYALANPAGIQTPISIQRDTLPQRWLRDVDMSADYIVITADEFEGSAGDLATWRRTHLRGIASDMPVGQTPRDARTAVVRVSDIYDEFSGGRPDVAAIRNFLKYAWLNWGSSLPEDRLRYVCLLGDANRDTRDREGTGVRNLVPTWEGGYDTATILDSNPAYASDDFFGRFDGPADRITDLAIGRIPVVDPEIAEDLIRRKIVGVESFDGFNPKRNRAILVADDVCQAGRSDPLGVTHILQTETIDRYIPKQFDRLKIYLYDYGQNDCSLLSRPGAKRDLIQAMNEGAWLVNYIGHGGDQVLADEKVLETTDVPSLTNLEDLSVLVAASCSVGKFNRAGSDGLAEALVKWPNGGCLGAIAATHLSFSGENEDLNRRILQFLFPGGDNRSVTLGTALLKAKIAQTMTTNFCSPTGDLEPCDRPKKYLLFGDPAAVIVGPNGQIRITEAPDTLDRGTLVTVRGEVMRPDSTRDESYQGMIDLLVEDQPDTRRAFGQSGAGIGAPYAIPGATIYSGRAAVTAGLFEATFVVPVSLRGGPRGRVRAYAAGGGSEAVGAISPLAIGGLDADAPGDTTAPSIVINVPGGTMAAGQVLTINIEDDNGINLTRLFEFRSIILTFLDDTELERFRADVTDDFQYETGSYRRGIVQTRVPNLPGGAYTVRLTATDNFNNRGEARLAVTIGTTGGAGDLTDLLALPNPFQESTEITFLLAGASPSVRVLVYSVSGRKVREWNVVGQVGENRLAWDGRDATGDAVANGVYLIKVAARPAAGGDEIDLIEPIVRLR
ncbi:MAG: C25 family cysteine peptidase [Candidatus Eisenbacteria bacterium]|nr:C25 family cysteine peptidase [Candidatus Eisenbacteria bacterium]